VQLLKLKLRHAVTQEFFLQLAESEENDLSLGHFLLAIELIRHLPQKKGLFQRKGKCAGFVIFEVVRKRAIQVLKDRCSRKAPCDGTTALLVLVNVLELIATLNAVKDRSALDKLRTMVGIDWTKGVEEVRTRRCF
jgi:hypothetical protein